MDFRLITIYIYSTYLRYHRNQSVFCQYKSTAKCLELASPKNTFFIESLEKKSGKFLKPEVPLILKSVQFQMCWNGDVWKTCDFACECVWFIGREKNKILQRTLYFTRSLSEMCKQMQLTCQKQNNHIRLISIGNNQCAWFIFFSVVFSAVSLISWFHLFAAALTHLEKL